MNAVLFLSCGISPHCRGTQPAHNRKVTEFEGQLIIPLACYTYAIDLMCVIVVESKFRKQYKRKFIQRCRRIYLMDFELFNGL